LRTTEEVEASKKSGDLKGYLGIVPTEYTLQRSTWSAPITAVGVTAHFTGLTYKGLATAIGSLFRGDTAKASSQVSGPVGVFVIIKDGSVLGIQFMLMIIALISLTLAIMNVLPIPALDGGRLFVTLVSRALKRPLSARQEELIHGLGFALLMLLLVLITVVDVRRFF
jgi:regulator of sigma E protease